MFRKIQANCERCQDDDTIESCDQKCLDVTQVIRKVFNAMAEKKQVARGGDVFIVDMTPEILNVIECCI